MSSADRRVFVAEIDNRAVAVFDVQTLAESTAEGEAMFAKNAGMAAAIQSHKQLIARMKERTGDAWEDMQAREAQMAAYDLVDAKWFRSDLRTLQRSDGKPLWDGKAEIFARPASEIERAYWERSRAHAIREGEITDTDDWLTFLSDIVDPTDEAFR